MKLSLKTAHGYLSVQPDGSLQFRDTVGPWETFELNSLEPTPPTPPVPPVVSYDVPLGTDFSDFQETEAFIKHARIIAFGEAPTGEVEYWEQHKQEMLDRGQELSMTPSERYYWERMIGRMSNPPAKAGPYKGLVDSNESLSEGA